jgi:predicted transposase/invertase (TIGR01784 family)
VLDYPSQTVRQYLVYIGKHKLTMADGLDLPDVRYRYRIIDMHQVDCDDFLRQESPDAWVLAILCDFKDKLPRDIIHAILTRLTRHFGKSQNRLREYVNMLDILSSNRDLNIDIFEELKMLTIDVEKLATYRLGMEKGMEKGMKKGIEEGIEEGKQKGAHNQAVEIAKKMLEAELNPGQITSLTGLTPEEVEQLRSERPKLNG